MSKISGDYVSFSLILFEIIVNYSQELPSLLNASDTQKKLHTSSPKFYPNSHPLLQQITQDEVDGVLASLRSKAKSSSSPASPFSLKLLSAPLTPLLVKIFNHCLTSCSFPKEWCDALFFLLHKKGDKNNPNNYRTICIENPFLKSFTTLLHRRFLRFCEENSLLPDSQFGFRPKLSCLSAASILHEIASSRLARKLRTYVCFVDLSKAFDTVNRPLLLHKLRLLGFPTQTCTLINNILSSVNYSITSNSMLSSSFKTNQGTPQGDPLSPLLFALFLSDLPQSLPSLQCSTPILLFADDIVLIAHNPTDLQSLINSLHLYTSTNFLTINTSKTVCLVFHRGRLPACSFFLNKTPLNRVNQFTYLGFQFSSQLSFSAHLNSLITKANSRIGVLFRQLPLTSLPLRTVLNVFNCYILPIFQYGLHLWLSKISASSLTSLNSLFTKYLKRYLLLPSFTPSSIVHHITNTVPLTNQLIHQANSKPPSIHFTHTFSNIKLSFLSVIPPHTPYFPFPDIPTTFWNTQIIQKIPSDPSIRKSLLYSVLAPFLISPWTADNH